MISANEIQAVLLGAGGFIGTSMAGIGAYRFFMSGAHKIAQIPVTLDRGAQELEKLRIAVENDTTLNNLVVEQGGILKDIRESIELIKQERQEISRELRIMARRVEGVCYTVPEQETPRG
jgi:hypothetical protein